MKQTERVRHTFLVSHFISKYDKSKTYCNHKNSYIKDILKSFDYVSMQINSLHPNWAPYIIKSVTCKITHFTNISPSILSDLILDLQERVSLSRFFVKSTLSENVYQTLYFSLVGNCNHDNNQDIFLTINDKCRLRSGYFGTLNHFNVLYLAISKNN